MEEDANETEETVKDVSMELIDLDKFPEAFRRFERQVRDVDDIRDYQELKLQFMKWAGERWKETPKQTTALAIEARKKGIPLISVRTREWRGEIVLVRGKAQGRYRDLRSGRFIKKPF
jgi:hypothetical protein